MYAAELTTAPMNCGCYYPNRVKKLHTIPTLMVRSKRPNGVKQVTLMVEANGRMV